MKHKLLIMMLAITFSLFAQKKPFTIEELYKIKSVSSQVISPGGDKIAFVLSIPNLQKVKTSTSIYLMNSDGSGLRQVTSSNSSSYAPVWSKDGKGIYFNSTRDGSEQVYYMRLDGGEPEQITNYPLGVSSPKFSKDGNLLLFGAMVYPECGVDAECNKKITGSTETGPIQAYLADSLFIRHWNEYETGQYSHVMLFNRGSKKVIDLTPGYFNSPTFAPGGSSNYSLSPDEKEAAFDSKRVEDPENSTNSDIWTVNIDGTGLKNITSKNEGADNDPKYSPDGKYIAYLTQTTPTYESDRIRLALYDRLKGESKILTESIDNWVNEFSWSKDSKAIYFTVQEKGYLPLYRINIADMKIEKLIENAAISSFDISPNNDFAVFTYTYTHKPVEIARFDFSTKKMKDLTQFNKEFTDSIDVRPSENVWVNGADGTPVHVFIVKPYNFDPNKKYPVVINVHGGPQMQWMDSFRGDWQVYPGAGYVVVYPNPHGSTGYGQKYTAAISNDWDGKVYEDIMKVTDYIETLPYVDKNRIGAMGWSYGGYFMNLLQGKTKRFKCLASMMGIYDLRQFKEDTEELWFSNWDLGRKDYQKMSPSEYEANFSTPTLIIAGKKDYRVTYLHSIRYFTVLQNKGIESRLIVFKNEGHWPNNLRSMPLYYNAHLEWFHKYLGGEPAPWDSKKMVRNMK
ncbi:MAG: S9 family peptidase [Bacteroidota bacterium]